MSSKLINLKEDDEVIIPLLNFTSSGIAVVNYGAVPVFIDKDRHTKYTEIEQIEEPIPLRHGQYLRLTIVDSHQIKML